MTSVVGYAQNPEVSVINGDNYLKALEKYPQIRKAEPGLDNCEYTVCKNVPEHLKPDIEWFARWVTQYLRAPMLYGDFSSPQDYDQWLSSVEAELQSMAEHNKLRLTNISRMNRLLSGFTTEAFAKELKHPLVHDDLQMMFKDFNTDFPLADFCSYSDEQKAAMVERLSQCLVKTVGLLEKAGLMQCKEE